MKKSKTSPGESYLERLKQNGLLTKENEEGHKEVAEMLNSPYSYEQAKAQVDEAEARRKKKRQKNQLRR